MKVVCISKTGIPFYSADCDVCIPTTGMQIVMCRSLRSKNGDPRFGDAVLGISKRGSPFWGAHNSERRSHEQASLFNLDVAMKE